MSTANDDKLHAAEYWFPMCRGPTPARALRLPLGGSGFRLLPLVTQVFHVGPFEVPLASAGVVTEYDIDYDAAAGRDATGAILWPASTLVVSLLLSTFSPAMSRAVLELGCGTGFCGLVARRLSQDVVLSDVDATMRSLASRNSGLQPQPVAVEAYGWGVGDEWPPVQGSFGLVLASDVLYNQDALLDAPMLKRFAALLDWSLDAHGIAIVGYVERNTRGLEDVVAALRRIFVVTVLSASECLPERLHVHLTHGRGLSRCQALWCARRHDPTPSPIAAA